jgi:hypothetical protein
LIVGIALVVIFIVDTEFMIQRSSGLVKPGESQWTFGQTLALLMLVLPMVEVAKRAKEWYKAHRERKRESEKRRELNDVEKADDKDQSEGGRQDVVINNDHSNDVELVCPTCRQRNGGGTRLIHEE